MLQRLLSLFGGARRRPWGVERVTIERGAVASFIAVRDGLPRIDWGAVEVWAERESADPARRLELQRAAAAVWLDELRDALESDHRRWRHERVEGLGPLAGDGARGISRMADEAIVTVERALAPIRGDAPVPPSASSRWTGTRRTTRSCRITTRMRASGGLPGVCTCMRARIACP